MPPAVEAVPEQTPTSLETDTRALAGILERHRYLILCLLTLIYAFGALAHARGKPLWYDEIITTIVASAPDVPTVWKAAGETDINPPLPHLLIHFSMQWFGDKEMGARIPAIAGFWIFCLCLYRFTRRRCGILYGLAALLIPIVTSAYSYAVEARGYGPELAFCGLALVAWQAAADGSRRNLALPGLAVSLSGATLCHYYAILLYLPLAGGEAFRWYRTRKFDVGVWGALTAGGAGLAWRVPVILGASRWSAHTWAPPSPEQILEFWETGLQHSLSFLVVLTAMLALAIIATRRKPEEAPDPAITLEDHELIAGVLFLAIPTVAVGGALLVTHMFTTRYALLALAGFAFLAPMAAAHLTGGRVMLGFLMTAALLAGFGLVTIDISGLENPFGQEPVLEKALQKEPVVISDGQLFLQMWQYAPEPLKPRLEFLADDEAAIRYMGFDTIDEGLRVLRPWTSARVVDYRDFFAPGREFLIYQSTLRQGWLLAKVLDDGGTAEILALHGSRELIRVRFKPRAGSE